MDTKNFFSFKGRMARKPYIIWSLAAVLAVSMLASFLAPRVSEEISFKGLLILFGWIANIIVIPITVQRLHDTGYSGWWILLGYGSSLVTGGLGGLVFTACLFLKKSSPLVNKYGASPIVTSTS